jgi:myo-inositol 2-dehydrogenase/D-chiro-inositol 1-dehydrogenase
MTAPEPVRCGVAGLGMIGEPHAAALAGSPLAKLAACCDTNPEVAARVPGGVPFTADLDEFLGLPGLEAVFVCTPQETHRAVVEQALARDLFVFCEKPIAHTLEDADALIEAAAAHPGHLVIGHTLRFAPEYVAVRDAVRSGGIGTIVSMAVRRCVPDFEGRLIARRTTLPVEVGIHDLDILQWLAGDIESVFAESAALGVTGPGLTDAVAGTLRFASGAVAVIELNWIMASSSARASDYRLAVFGTAGSAFAEFQAPAAAAFGTGIRRTGWLDDIYGSHSGVLKTEDEHFLGVVRGNRSWPLTVHDSRSALAAALALDRSVALGRPVRVGDE